MAHEIDQTTGRAAFMAVGSQAWHGLGQVVDSAQTSADAIKLAGLDWEVQTQHLTTLSGIEVPSHRAVVRSDTGAVLGCVGHKYAPLQNSEAFGWMDSIAGEGLAHWHTAGALRGGRHVFMLAKLPKVIRVTDRDILEQYVLVVNGHDGTKALTLFPTSIRVVCANTLRLAESLSAGSAMVRLIHRAEPLSQRVSRARDCLGIIEQRHDLFKEQVEALARHAMDTGAVEGYFRSVVPSALSDRGVERVVGSFYAMLHNERNSGLDGRFSAWTAYNAVSEYADHGMGTRGTSAENRRDNRVSSVLFGSAARLKENAFSAALALTK
jgi:phage/plasmid-like protein (TIGR03299 family)